MPTRWRGRSSPDTGAARARGLFAEGVAVRQVGAHCFHLAQQVIDEVVIVSNDEICAAIKDVFDDTRTVMEPAGALSWRA